MKEGQKFQVIIDRPNPLLGGIDDEGNYVSPPQIYLEGYNIQIGIIGEDGNLKYKRGWISNKEPHDIAIWLECAAKFSKEKAELVGKKVAEDCSYSEEY